jgi:hypothetical protein
MLLRISCVSAPPLGAISAGHLAIDHGRTQRLRGTPIRGIDREVELEAEDGRELRREMRREALAVRRGAGSREEVQQSRHVARSGRMRTGSTRR